MAPIFSKVTGHWSDYYEKRISIVKGRAVTRCHCTLCPKSVARKSDFPRHLAIHTGEGLLFCDVEGCERKKGFHQLSNLRVHQKAKHQGVKYVCPDLDEAGVKCGQVYSGQARLIHHRREKHSRVAGKGPSYTTVIKQEADNDELVIPPAQPSKRARAAHPLSSPRRSRKMKSTPTKSAPVQVRQIDSGIQSSFPTAGSSTAPFFTLSDAAFSFGYPSNDRPINVKMELQPSFGAITADSLSFSPFTTPATLGELCNPEPQTAAANKWVFPPGNTFDYPSVSLPLPLPARNHRATDEAFDATMLVNGAAYDVPQTSWAGFMPNAGLAPESADAYYCHPGWGSGAPDAETDVSRESTPSLDSAVFDAVRAQWTPRASEFGFSGYYPF